MNVNLPNGIVLENVPDDLTQAEISEVAIRNGLATEKDFEHDFSAMNLVKNLPKSFGNAWTSLGEAVASPLETGRNIYGLARGMMGKAGDTSATEEQTKAADYAIRSAKSTYGNWQNFKRALEEDPFGIASTVALPVGVAGAALRGVGAAANLPRLAQAGRIASGAATAVDPINIGLNTVAAAPRAIGRSTVMPHRMYQRAFGAPHEDVSDFMLEKGYLPNRESYNQYMVDQAIVQQNITRAVANNPELEDLLATETMLRELRRGAPGERANIDAMMAELGNQIDMISPGFNGMRQELQMYGRGHDVYNPAIRRAYTAEGDIGQDMVIPTGVGYAVGAGLGLPPWVSIPAIMTAGTINRPGTSARVARSLHNMNGPLEGYLDNSLLRTITQQTISNIGEEGHQKETLQQLLGAQ